MAKINTCCFCQGFFWQQPIRNILAKEIIIPAQILNISLYTSLKPIKALHQSSVGKKDLEGLFESI